MTCVRVLWTHKSQTRPRLLVSELDVERREVRKVELFANGTVGYASQTTEHGGTVLGITSIPEIMDIAAQTEFEPTEILEWEFEAIWSRATSGSFAI